MSKTVLIIGAGPAGLTAARELLRRSTDYTPIVVESLDDVGGISRTINHNGNRMDIGGHRFFSKSDWVMSWWREILPVAPEKTADGLSVIPPADRYLLIRPRLSRIYFLRKFFDYPISLSANTMRNLGFMRLLKIGCSYTFSSVFQRKPERNLEDFFVNRFGNELYSTFFKDYTEKVWGVPCREISPEWGAQRIKGLSVVKAISHSLRKLVRGSGSGVAQKGVNTSLIERFLYPKFGPGQMWQVVAEMVRAGGGEIHHGVRVKELREESGRIVAVVAEDKQGQGVEYRCDFVISTMPVRDMVLGLSPPAPEVVREVAAGLCYRDFITVGVLVKKLRPTRGSLRGHKGNLVPDTWIYIQEPDVKLGRLQLFNNWSPAMVRDADTIWLGLEYFCQEGDELWCLSDEEMGRFAVDELARIDLIDAADALDFNVVRVPKAYPAYFGTYDQFEVLRRHTDTIENLFLVGRNGMHRYNNQDHSMLTARLAVEAILSGSCCKDDIWGINVDDEYHEEKK
ncbi:NAD(P)/FAD-dependent oxidoreductase [Candidatus Accumulibacter sp. ACC007]|uniref:NAD(P)/FAD-dependent oxidoreductase n=1 Tax=Candidatus Accumulibacter sp. ACC007 TaxID=2823333 RepID=UPI0025BA213B|nr:NAD(P)/FAD-dependent oxidoreductase [Candidatus Accumulibacter sp. ACC007]